MIPDPLHPALVHLPIAFAVLAPFFAAAIALAIRAGAFSSRFWAAVVLFQALLAGSAWLGVETGEREEERVERVVAESHIEEHEEAAEFFLWAAAAVVLISGTGLLAGSAGGAGRLVTVLAAAAVLAAAIRVGHSGGELVYVHGAAAAYAKPASGEVPPAE
jgi:uncharacterized membrane protein